MEVPISTLLLSISSAFLIWICIYTLKTKSQSKKLPPGPYSLPIIGNIFQLGLLPHASLAKLSKIHGPVMTIKLGNKVNIVVSSSEIARRLLTRNDHKFPRRIVTDAMRALDHDKFSVIWMPALGRWRNLRKICTEQIFSSEKINASQSLRQEKVQQLSDYLRKCRQNGTVVDIREAAFTASLNLISSTIFSVDFACYGSSSSEEMKEIITEVNRILGTSNVADVLTFLTALDPLGVRRKAEVILGKLLQSFDGLITERVQERQKSSDYSRKHDFLETLLDLSQENEAEWSQQDIKHLTFDLFFAGTETNSVTVEWAMAELLRNPEKLRKARNEIKEVLGTLVEN